MEYLAKKVAETNPWDVVRQVVAITKNKLLKGRDLKHALFILEHTGFFFQFKSLCADQNRFSSCKICEKRHRHNHHLLSVCCVLAKKKCQTCGGQGHNTDHCFMNWWPSITICAIHLGVMQPEQTLDRCLVRAKVTHDFVLFQKTIEVIFKSEKKHEANYTRLVGVTTLVSKIRRRDIRDQFWRYLIDRLRGQPDHLQFMANQLSEELIQRCRCRPAVAEHRLHRKAKAMRRRRGTRLYPDMTLYREGTRANSRTRDLRYLYIELILTGQVKIHPWWIKNLKPLLTHIVRERYLQPLSCLLPDLWYLVASYDKASFFLDHPLLVNINGYIA